VIGFPSSIVKTHFISPQTNRYIRHGLVLMLMAIITIFRETTSTIKSHWRSSGLGMERTNRQWHARLPGRPSTTRKTTL